MSDTDIVSYIKSLERRIANLEKYRGFMSLLSVTARSTVPTSPFAGLVYLDDGTNTGTGQPAWRYYTGTLWKNL